MSLCNFFLSHFLTHDLRKTEGRSELSKMWRSVSSIPSFNCRRSLFSTLEIILLYSPFLWLLAIDNTISRKSEGMANALPTSVGGKTSTSKYNRDVEEDYYFKPYFFLHFYWLKAPLFSIAQNKCLWFGLLIKLLWHAFYI